MSLKMDVLTWQHIIENIDKDIFQILSQNHHFYLNNHGFVDASFDVRSPNYHQKLHVKAAKIIQTAWRRYQSEKIYASLKAKLYDLTCRDPQAVLRRVNPQEASYLDKGSGQVLVFRLDGRNFPPKIVYKIFTGMKIVTFHNVRKRRMGNVKIKNQDETAKPRNGWKVFFEYQPEKIKWRRKGEMTQNPVAKRKRAKSNITWISEKYGV